MNIGLYDVDSHNFPNLPLMKLSAWHKKQGDNVEFINRFKHYDKVYVSKVFGDEYSTMDDTVINADEIVYGGTGFCITIEDGKEVFDKEKDKPLPDEIEHIMPDYSLYPDYKKACGFLTRGCPNNCPFCIVSKKEGRVSHKVANLSEFWNGQKAIDLMDANILSCRDHLDLLSQLRDSGARINFLQGLDARFLTQSNINLLKEIKVEHYHFAFDLMENKERIVGGLKLFRENIDQLADCYVLTNFNTTFEEDMERVKILQELNIRPYVMIYRKNTAPKRLKDLQRWSNNRFIYASCPNFEDYKKGGIDERNETL